MKAWFHGRVTETPSGCWEWKGFRHPYGYGVVRVRCKRWLAHRYAWVVVYGPIDSDLDVLHRCDNPPCVNPDHLFLGDQAANAADAASKGRMARGERQHLAKLTEADVLAIRSSIGSGESLRSVARAHGIYPSTVRSIRDRRTWRHI